MDFVAKTRQEIASFEVLPQEPSVMEDFKNRGTGYSSGHHVTMYWVNIPEPPEGTVGRERIVNALASIHKEVATAERDLEFAYKGFAVHHILNQDDVAMLRKHADEALQNATKVANELDPLLKNE